MTDPSDPATLRALADDMRQRVVVLRQHQADLVSSIGASAFEEPMAAFTATEAVLREAAASLEMLKDENEDLHLVAQGVKHYWGCEHNAVSGGGPYFCERCRAETAEALCATLRHELAVVDESWASAMERLAAAEASRDEARRQVEKWRARAETAEVALDKAWTELAARAPQEQP